MRDKREQLLPQNHRSLHEKKAGGKVEQYLNYDKCYADRSTW